MWLVFIILSLTLNLIVADSSECGVIVDDKIIGGQTADLDEFPWLALLEYKNEKNELHFNCMGTLINKRYVLTAATCLASPLTKNKWNVTSVRLGEYNLETEEDCVQAGASKVCARKPLNIGIEEVISHENYSGQNNYQFDIGLIRLAEDVQFSDYIAPICLPKQGTNKSYSDKTAYASGWDRTKQSTDNSNQKLKISLPIVNNTRCDEIFKSKKIEISPSQICAGGVEGVDTCQGDTGGPLMVIDKDEKDEPHWYGIGVVSFGMNPCGTKGTPGVYTRVSSFMDWVNSNMRI